MSAAISSLTTSRLRTVPLPTDRLAAPSLDDVETTQLKQSADPRSTLALSPARREAIFQIANIPQNPGDDLPPNNPVDNPPEIIPNPPDYPEPTPTPPYDPPPYGPGYPGDEH